MNASEVATGESASPVVLRGTRNGLEVFASAGATVEAITGALAEKLGESPQFFAGGDVMVRFDGDPPAGVLSRLEETTSEFGLRVIEVRSNREERLREKRAALAAVYSLEEEQRAEEEEPGEDPLDAPPADPLPPDGGGQGAGPLQDHVQEEAPEAVSPRPEITTGPVRSGVVVEAPEDLIVFGDVNPGAELRAGRSIVVLGTLRGVAHASARGGTDGFILALRLEPQQVRIGPLLARPADADHPPGGAEIAFANEGRIEVERYAGKLPGSITARR